MARSLTGGAAAPRAGVLARGVRLVFGERVKRAHVSDHGALMRTLGGRGPSR